MLSVVSSMNGSMYAVVGSGISSMSEASMPFHPAIDEPSNAWPSSNFSLSNIFDGTETCCSLPRVSVKRRSTNFTSFSWIILRTSAAVAMQFSCRGWVDQKGTSLRCRIAEARFSDNYAMGPRFPSA